MITSLCHLFIDTDSPLDQGDLKTCGNNILFICKVAQLALAAFCQGNLKEFDPLVKDESCQFRASKIGDLYEELEKSSFASLEKEVKIIYNQSQQKIADLGKLKGKTPFKQYFGEILKVDEKVHFIVLSYLLTKSKEEVVSDKGNLFKKDISKPENLQALTESTPTNRQIKKIVANAQVKLAQLSADYALQLSGMENQQHLVRVVEGKMCVPCFYGMEALLKDMLKRDKKLLVEVELGNNPDESCGTWKQLYKSNLSKDGFEPLQNFESEDPDTAVVVIAGHSINQEHTNHTRNHFQIPNIYEVILANTAQHRQFPDGQDDGLPQDPRKDNYIAKARLWGCTEANKNLFLIDHIFVRTIKELK